VNGGQEQRGRTMAGGGQQGGITWPSPLAGLADAHAGDNLHHCTVAHFGTGAELWERKLWTIRPGTQDTLGDQVRLTRCSHIQR
jgi:hypothetical protein